MLWASYIKGFRSYLKLERSLAAHSVEAYLNDVDKLSQYFQAINSEPKLSEI